MKDIDFDELDRAVNSLISPGAKSPTPTPDAAPTTPAVEAVTSPTVQTTTAPLAERRSSGRFMDVVHPSSDMRPVTVPARSTTVTESQPASPSIQKSDTSQTKQTTSAWPDPIDMHETSNSQTQTIEPDEPKKAEEPVVDSVPPQESPFLSNTVVEKRPLGAFSNEVEESGPSEPAVTPEADLPKEQDASVESNEKSSDHPIQTDTPLPAELQPGLLSIESNEGSASSDKAMALPATPVVSTSITQQYVEQPSTGDKPAGAVFDAEAYKKPQTTKKKKSGWLVVLWIFLLLIIGAGIGAAVYFFVLPQL